MSRCGKSKTDTHSCRNLHRLLANTGKMLDVKISTTPLWVRYSRRRPQQALVKYPILRMTDWMDCIFRHGGHFALGGNNLDHVESFGKQLCQFWENYQVIEPGLPFFEKFPKSEWCKSIPIAIHGDEGRGKAKNPVMIVTVQVIMPVIATKTNMEATLDILFGNVFMCYIHHGSP